MKTNMQQTSLEAYKDLIDKLPEKRRVVYEAIKHLGIVCNYEIAQYLYAPINSITPRTNELVKIGLVQEVDKKVSPTGKKAIYWGVVTHGSGQGSLF